MFKNHNTTCVKMFKCGRLSVCWFMFYLILLALTKDSADAQEIRSPANEFSRYRLVQPTVHHARTKREISTTKHADGLHHPEVTMTIDIDGEPHVLDLRLNTDLVAGDHILSYQKDGQTILHKPTIEELDICQYSGKVRGKEASWAALSTCHGVRGIIHDGKQMRYIEPAEGNAIDTKHYIYDHSDLSNELHCGYVGGVTNNTAYDPDLMKQYKAEKNRDNSRISRYKRDAYDETELRGPFNANKLSRYVELVLVADNREYRANGESLNTVHRQLKDVANIINSVYAPLNIFIALVGVVVWSERDEIQLEENGDKTLTHFLHYRRNRLVHDIPNDNAHLLTRQKFNDGVVGKALKGPICTYQFSGGVATNHSEVIGLVATTIAHEMGHNFGMEHDTETDCQCPDEKCIMSPSSTSVTPTHWSSCSLRSLALSFEKGMDYCLRNKPKRLFESPTCGNGFIEPGEQCDCGLAPSAACAACCRPRACLLRANATCAAGQCCDPLTCRPKSAGTVCRSADKECDLPEYCSGYSEFCPKDVFKMDATPCSNNEAFCVKGSCRTHTDQCRLLWGSTGEMSDTRCYMSSNLKGDSNGNCGYQKGDQPVYYKCSKEDALCGLLQCKHLNERLEFGMESVAVLKAVFINNNGTILTCRTAMIDLGLSDVDPGMVPDGAKCGDDRMCLNQRCVSVAAYREQIARQDTSVCPSNCSGHGVCNSEGHCHCEAGFAPPLCALPGPGGSVDSGPASDSSIQRNFMVAMYVIFLGIVPSILLILLLMYYSRHNVLVWWKKPRKTYVSHLFKKNMTKSSTVNPSKKSYFNIKFSSFSSTSSFIKLISFKRKDERAKEPAVCKKCITEIKENENIYANICDHENDYESLKSNNNLNKLCWHQKFMKLLNKNKNKREIKRFHRKINKDDIKVADNNEMIDVKNIRNKNDNNSDGKKKVNIEIINTGLASTTNEFINRSNIKPLSTTSNNELQTKTKNVSINIHKPINSKLNIENKLNIVKAGPSTTNVEILRNNEKLRKNNKSIIKNNESIVRHNGNNEIQLNVKELRNKFNQPTAHSSNLPKRSDLRKK